MFQKVYNLTDSVYSMFATSLESLERQRLWTQTVITGVLLCRLARRQSHKLRKRLYKNQTVSQPEEGQVEHPETIIEGIVDLNIMSPFSFPGNNYDKHHAQNKQKPFTFPQARCRLATQALLKYRSCNGGHKVNNNKTALLLGEIEDQQKFQSR